MPPAARRAGLLAVMALLAVPACGPRAADEPPAVVRYEAAAQRLEAYLDAALVETGGPDCATACDLLRELAARTAALCAPDPPTPPPAACADARDRLRRRSDDVQAHCLCDL